MNKLIKEAENLYKQIDKAQVHLVNARLNNDEEGKKSAISEMETAMCNAMQFLKCIIDRKDNIVDLSKIWKDGKVEKPLPYSEIVRHHNFNIGNAIKYLWRAGLKREEGMPDKDKQIEDLRKALFYINDEIERIKDKKEE